MKREFLRNVLEGVEGANAMIAQIMAEHGKKVDEVIQSTEKALTKQLQDNHRAELAERQKSIDELTKKVENLENEKESTINKLVEERTQDLDQKYKILEGEFESAKVEWETKETNRTKAELVTQALTNAEGERLAAGLIPKAVKMLNLDTVELKDGEITNLEKVMEVVKSEWGEFFGKVEERGKPLGVNQGGKVQGESKIVTAEMVKNASTNEERMELMRKYRQRR